MNDIRYYNKQGEPISSIEWTSLLTVDGGKYRIVDRTTLPNGTYISTVWLGLDHNYSFLGYNHAPLIFETMVFNSPPPWEGEEYQERYSTLKEAKAGHKEAVRKFKH